MMTDTELLDAIERLELRLVRRPRDNGGWSWVVFNQDHTVVHPRLRGGIEMFVRTFGDDRRIAEERAAQGIEPGFMKARK